MDPQVRADKMGQGVDVNQNDYTKASLERRREAVNALEKAVGVNERSKLEQIVLQGVSNLLKRWSGRWDSNPRLQLGNMLFR